MRSNWKRWKLLPSKIVLALAATVLGAGTSQAQQFNYIQEAPTPQVVPEQIPPPAGVEPPPMGVRGVPYNEMNCVSGGCSVIDTCCKSRPSCWSAYGMFLYLYRDNPNSQTLLRDAATGASLGNASNYDFGWAPGLEFGLSRQLSACTDLSIRYMGVYDMSANQSIDYFGNAITTSTPPILFIAPGTVTSEISSTLHSVEANIGRRIGRRTRLEAGVRWLHLAEDVVGNTVQGNGFVTTTGLSTTNNLYGLQVGGNSVLWQDRCRRFDVVGWGKAGAYYNNVQASTSFSDNFGNSANGSDSDSAIAFVGELGIDFRYALTRNLWLTCGGQVLWLSNVATAIDQAGRTTGINADGSVALSPDTHNDVLLYGFNVGLTATW